MAKRRYRRYRRSRGKWAANIQRLNGSGTVIAGGPLVEYVTIAQNPAQNASAVSQIFRVKNVEIACQLESVYPQLENIEYYIMFVPEGYPLPENGDLPFKHPEWIMAYKYIGNGVNSFGPTSSSTYSSNDNTQVPRIKSRLARKLQTGDQILFVLLAQNNSTSNTTVSYHGLVRWWTKAN
jgi:hypothetical protein